MDLQIFANCQLPVSNTFKDMQSKIWEKVVLLKYRVLKILLLYVLQNSKFLMHN